MCVISPDRHWNNLRDHVSTKTGRRTLMTTNPLFRHENDDRARSKGVGFLVLQVLLAVESKNIERRLAHRINKEISSATEQ